MTLAMILSLTALGISIVVSAISLINWFVHTDPRTLIRTGRRLLFVLGTSSIPCLVVLLIYQQWTAATLLGAGMLIVPTLLSWRSLFTRSSFQPMWSEDGAVDSMHGNFGHPAPDPELARRAAIVLQDYLTHVGHQAISAPIDAARPSVQEPPTPHGASMAADEALDILGLAPGATPLAIQAAHRRLMQLVHPDRGGTNYLAAKINAAKTTLLAETTPKPRAPTRRRVRTARERTHNRDVGDMAQGHD